MPEVFSLASGKERQSPRIYGSLFLPSRLRRSILSPPTRKKPLTPHSLSLTYQQETVLLDHIRRPMPGNSKRRRIPPKKMLSVILNRKLEVAFSAWVVLCHLPDWAYQLLRVQTEPSAAAIYNMFQVAVFSFLSLQSQMSRFFLPVLHVTCSSGVQFLVYYLPRLLYKLPFQGLGHPPLHYKVLVTAPIPSWRSQF